MYWATLYCLHAAITTPLINVKNLLETKLECLKTPNWQNTVGLLSLGRVLDGSIIVTFF
jgi:hypothetical protein